MRLRISHAVFASATLLLSHAAHAANKGLAIGTGVAYPTVNHTLFVNPAGLTDAGTLSLQGAYLMDPEEIHASLVTGSGSFGLGAGYRSVGESSIEEFGLGFGLGSINFGVTLRSVEFDNFGADVGAIFGVGGLRAALVLRDVTDSLSRLDFGIAKAFGQVVAEFDVKKLLDGDAWLFDAALAATSGKITAGVGYTFSYFNGFQEGDIHAGLSLEIASGVAAEFMYRPHSQEWSPGDWVLGARATF
jgi:hypothetical protein